ncbi:MAG: beta-ketoacyl-[acyl-carrier-protein] synthase family protein [Gammaproteobacteria bacterium]|nr:beta-ketoacyl-[acyl-carrier-protein] synthase family protein [Gammaproteobacteria bacterium]
MSRTVVVTGLGAVSGLGLTVPQFWKSLVEGRSGFTELKDTAGWDSRLKVRFGARVPGYDPLRFFSADEIPLLDRHTQFALIAAKEAVADADLDDQHLFSAGVVLGTGCGGKETDEETYCALYQRGKSRVHPLTIPRGMPSAAASQLSMKLAITGPVFSISSACSSANHAVIQSQMMIRAGLVDIVLAGGTDAPFTFGLLKSWEAMRVLASDTCRPFSANRNGLILGEGAGILVLESFEHALSRGARIYGEIAGCGMSADAAHITVPSVDGAAKAINYALQDGGIEPAQVDYVNAHGTGTKINDPFETRILHQVFGDHANRLMVSSTKSMHGHTLGAAGAHELIATLLAIRDSHIPPTANFTEPGEGCDLDYVPNQSRDSSINVAISNSFAFGGLNAVIAVRRLD